MSQYLLNKMLSTFPIHMCDAHKKLKLNNCTSLQPTFWYAETATTCIPVFVLVLRINRLRSILLVRSDIAGQCIQSRGEYKRELFGKSLQSLLPYSNEDKSVRNYD
jgi:hypothetical protein